ncbi:hypothetical protein [Microvirga pudoricolor]|uniref:hypothetical protein n=1 Tax=Microvirga pudoricolor TaxID=2778729 RepID=UPI00195286A4|nr:hypothetical protein [Microvirga pudoricolor]MBM6595415.1 hypothetical protein [Microvirga pudoricolor]
MPAARYFSPMSSTIDLKWVLKRPQDETVAPDPEVWIDVARLDEAWRGGGSYYVAFAGQGGSEERVARAGERLTDGLETYMPEICLEADGTVTFADGRHRFAWCRDHGVSVMPVAVCRECEDEVRRRFGTDSRASQVEIPS